MRILILGPQGSGKGTQAKRIAAAYGVPHVATGDMFRAAVAEGSELGRKVEPLLEEGLLVPDDLTIELIRERLAKEDGFVLDEGLFGDQRARKVEVAARPLAVLAEAAQILDHHFDLFGLEGFAEDRHDLREAAGGAAIVDDREPVGIGLPGSGAAIGEVGERLVEADGGLRRALAVGAMAGNAGRLEDFLARVELGLGIRGDS